MIAQVIEGYVNIVTSNINILQPLNMYKCMQCKKVYYELDKALRCC